MLFLFTCAGLNSQLKVKLAWVEDVDVDVDGNGNGERGKERAERATVSNEDEK
jgi:hypothetical protein